MPLRWFGPEQKEKSEQDERDPVIEKRSLWRTGLLLATSAALGGIAVALWDRRTLAQMRQPAPPTDESP